MEELYSECRPQLVKHLQSEDTYTTTVLKEAGAHRLKQQIIQRLYDLMPDVQPTPPESIGRNRYVLQGSSYLCLHPNGRQTTLLSEGLVQDDVEQIRRRYQINLGLDVATIKMCPQQRLLAYLLPMPRHADVYCALVRDVHQGQLLAEHGVVQGVSGIELAADGATLLYTRPDALGRPCEVLWRDVWSGAEPSAPLLREPAPSAFLALGRTKDWAFLLVSANSKTASQVHLLPAGQPRSTPRLVQAWQPSLEYFVEHCRGQLVILTNAVGLPHITKGSSSSSGGEPGTVSNSLSPAATLDHVPNSTPASAALQCTAAGASSSGGGTASAAGLHQVARELTLACADVALSGIGNWRRLLPVPAAREEEEVAGAGAAAGGLQAPQAVITDMDMFSGLCVLYERHAGVPEVSVLSFHLPAGHSTSNAHHVAEGSSNGDGSPPPSPGTQGCTGAVGGAAAGHALACSSTGAAAAAAAAAGGGSAGASRLSLAKVPLPPWALHVSPGVNADFHARTLRLCASSPLHAPVNYDYHFETGELQQVARQQLPAAAQQLVSACTLARTSVRSYDGTEVPLTLVLPPGMHVCAGPGPGPSLRPRLGRSAAFGHQQQLEQLSNGQGGIPGAGAGAGQICSPSSGSSSSSGTSAISHAACLGPARVLHAPLLPTSGAGGAEACRTGGAHGAEAPQEEQQQQQQQQQEPARAAAWHASGGPRPLLLCVYGAYGLPLELDFDATVLPLLEAGWVVARVHVRGGGELGRGWHAAGSRAGKVKGVEDYLAAVDALIGSGITAPGLVAGHAISAGGLVLGAALNQQPHAFGAAVLRCAYLDLLATSTSPHLPLTLHEHDEWGDPVCPDSWRAMQGICPYHNIPHAAGPPNGLLSSQRQQLQPVEGAQQGAGPGEGPPGVKPGSGSAERALPAILASCAMEDPRVPSWVPAKWVARWRQRMLGANAAPAASADTADDASAASAPWTWARALQHAAGSWLRPGAADTRGRAGGRPGAVGSQGGALRGCVLLRVHDDGAGHTRQGASQVEEAAEEMAFLLSAIGGNGKQHTGRHA